MLNEKPENLIKMEDNDDEQFTKLFNDLFCEPYHSSLSTEAKVLYSIMRDRLKLSQQNGWADEDGSVYFIFTRKEIMDVLRVGEKKVRSLMNQLKNADLLYEEQVGLSYPNRIYLCPPVLNSEAGSVKTNDQNLQKEAPEPSRRSSIKTESIKTDKNKNTSSKEEGGEPQSLSENQKPLFDDSKFQTNKKQDDRRSQKQVGLDKIEKASQGLIPWKDVSFRDLTFYFIEQHNKIMPKSIKYDRYSSVSIIRDSLIKQFDIPINQACRYIDEMLNVYNRDASRWSQLSFRMISNNHAMMERIMKSVKENIKLADREKKVEKQEAEKQENLKMAEGAELVPFNANNQDHVALLEKYGDVTDEFIKEAISSGINPYDSEGF